MIRYRLREGGSRSSLFVEGKYRLEYEPRTVVTAPEGTLGIFCFKTREDAINFINQMTSPCENWKVY